jgi:hypothetical protein
MASNNEIVQRQILVDHINRGSFDFGEVRDAIIAAGAAPSNWMPFRGVIQYFLNNRTLTRDPDTMRELYRSGLTLKNAAIAPKFTLKLIASQHHFGWLIAEYAPGKRVTADHFPDRHYAIDDRLGVQVDPRGVVLFEDCDRANSVLIHARVPTDDHNASPASPAKRRPKG